MVQVPVNPVGADYGCATDPSRVRPAILVYYGTNQVRILPQEIGMPGETWTQEDVRRFALSLPEAHEHSHFGKPDIRVRNKIFVTLPEDGLSVNVKVTPIELDHLVRADPEAFRDVWGGRWMGVVLARVPAEMVHELIIDAYCLAAPKKLAASVQRT